MSIKKDKLKITKPHTIASKRANDADADTIVELSLRMQSLCAELVKSGMYKSIYALHHSQITTSPINFFSLNMTDRLMQESFGKRPSFIFVNAKIINHTQVPIDSDEGCVSFPGEPSVWVKRYNKIVCQYQYPIEQANGEYSLSEVITENMSGLLARIIQHEDQHSQGKYIYNLK